MRYDTEISPQSSQNRVISMICNDGPVFDVGCATGNLGKALRKQNKDNEIYGLEIDPEAREVALQKNIYKDIFLANLDRTLNLAQSFRGYFKYIILADVLEHLQDAAAALEQLRPMLRKDGCFLISLPNVMNFEVQAKVASATAKYTYDGLLDYTHLHFYDSDEIAALANKVSCVIKNLSFTYRNLEKIQSLSDPAVMPLQVSNYIFKNNPYAWEFQYIFELHPSELPEKALDEENRKVISRSLNQGKYDSEKYVVSSLLKLYYRSANEDFSEKKSIHVPVFMAHGVFSVDLPLTRLADEDIFLRLDFGRAGEIWEWGNVSWYDKGGGFLADSDLDSLKKDNSFSGITFSGKQFKINQDPCFYLKRECGMNLLHIAMSFANRGIFSDIGKKVVCYFSANGEDFNENSKVESFLNTVFEEILTGEISVPAKYEKASLFRIELGDLKEMHEIVSGYILDAEHNKIPLDLKKLSQDLCFGVAGFVRDSVENFYTVADKISIQIPVDNTSVEKIVIQLKPVDMEEKGCWIEQASAKQTYEKALRETEDKYRQLYAMKDTLDNENRVLQAKLESERREHEIYEKALRKTEDILRQKYRDCESLARTNSDLLRDVAEKEKFNLLLQQQITNQENTVKNLQDRCCNFEAKLAEREEVCRQQSLQINEISLACSEKESLLDEIYNSKSWRLTAPYRKVMNLLRYWRANGTRAFLKKICGKIEAKSSGFARLMECQRQFRDVCKEQGKRKALSLVYWKAYKKIFPVRYIQKIHSRYCEEYSHACCIIDHNLGGGANVYRNNFIREKLNAGEKCVLLHNNMYFYDHRDYSLKFYDKTLERFEDVHFQNLQEVFAVLDKLSPSSVVYNSLVYYPDMASVLHWMKKCKGKLLLLIHDFFPVCQVYNMVDDRNQYCQSLRNCDECLSKHDNIRHLYGKPFTKAEWRKLWKPVFARSNEIRFFSTSTLEIFKSLSVGNEKKYSLVPHSMAYYTPPDVNIVCGNKPKIAVIGSIYNVPKGTLIVEELAREMAPEPLVIIGSYDGNLLENIVVTGAFTRETLAGLIEQHSINMLLLPSIWPETFSYLASEIIMMKIPLLVFDLGAQKDKALEYCYGEVIPEMTAKSVLETADRLFRKIKNDF